VYVGEGGNRRYVIGGSVGAEFGQEFGARGGKRRGKGLQQAAGEELDCANDQISALAQECILLGFSLCVCVCVCVCQALARYTRSWGPQKEHTMS
jgi:hypothetical protein